MTPFIAVLLAAVFLTGHSIAKDTWPVFPKNARILFQGDSITDAIVVGPRTPTTSWATAINLSSPPNSRGIVNDVNAGMRATNRVSAERLDSDYDSILAQARAANPQLKLVLCEPFILPGRANQDRWEDWQADIRKLQQVVEKLATKYQAPVVHFQKVFADATNRAPVGYWIWDGIHPTYAGHQLMADEWVRVYGSFYGSPLLDPQRNSAVAPTPKLEQDSYDWYGRHAAVLNLQQKMRPEIVLVGDSITHFWSGEPMANHPNGSNSWERTFGGQAVLNLGFGWDRTQNVLWRLDHGRWTV